MTITATVAVQLYFVKRRALASSMAVTGTAAGVFFWPPFARFLMDVYAWQGACLIIGEKVNYWYLDKITFIQQTAL